ncbi:hypothetical protein [Mariniphaga anaerophila]|uniref:hypothetical protein n=1 Tax=Mariniphaga anaerophila TaxID=1484053 RepID=UPI0009355B38|nr:hypothetical protein [Mariniphaga anaerophila]
MNYIRHLRGFFDRLEEDANMTSHHISLYITLFHVWNLNRFREYFEVNRQDVMSMARIGSRNTYSRCMKELHAWGYIIYSPAGNRYQASHVSCIRFDTAKETATDAGRETTNGTASGTPLINYKNKIKDKQGHAQKMKNGEEKSNRGNPLHVETDKDYAEPL